MTANAFSLARQKKGLEFEMWEHLSARGTSELDDGVFLYLVVPSDVW